MNNQAFILPQKWAYALGVAVIVFLVAVPIYLFKAASTSDITQVISAGTLTVDIRDASRVSVSSPSVSLTSKTFSFNCQSGGSASTGSLGSNTQRIYVDNPSATSTGWNLSIAATSGATALWTSGGNTYDFNDATGSGCTDGADADSKGGQLTINPAAGAITTDCSSCTTTGVSLQSSAAFVQTTTDSVTLVVATSGSDPVWRGYFTGISLSQTIPAEAPAGTYTLNMTLTITAT